MKSFCRNSKTYLYLRNIFVGVALCSLLFLGGGAVAQDMTTIQPLSFGEIAISDYSSVGRVTISSTGSYTTSSNVYVKTAPTRGEYQLTGYPADTIYTITFPASVSLTGPGNVFTLDNLGSFPALLMTDSAGTDNFYIYGRLQTQGGGASYIDGTYQTTFTIDLNF